MKKTLKNICGMSLVLALGFLSFLVTNENESAEAADARVQIKAWNWSCSWLSWFDFGAQTIQTVDKTYTKTWWRLSHSYLDTVERWKAKKCTIWLSGDLVDWSGNSIAKNKLTLQSPAAFVTPHWNLSNPIAINSNLWSDIIAYTRVENEAGDAYQDFTGSLIVPAYQVPGTYVSPLKATYQ